MIMTGKIDDISGIYIITSNDGESYTIKENGKEIDNTGLERAMFYYASSLISPWDKESYSKQYTIVEKDDQYECELHIICNDVEEVSLCTYGYTEVEAININKIIQQRIQEKYNPNGLHLWDKW